MRKIILSIIVEDEKEVPLIMRRLKEDVVPAMAGLD